MSSFQFRDLLKNWLPDTLCEQFRLMVYTSSLLYNLGNGVSYSGITPLEFRMTLSKAGTALLESLEKLLRPAHLAKALPENKRAIFLVLFGTILAVGYSGSSYINSTSEVRYVNVERRAGSSC
jgi:hypothetical protein